MRNLICAFTITAIAICAMPSTASGKVGRLAAKAFRIIPIQKRDHGYHNLETVVLRTKEDLDDLLRLTQKQTGWNDRKGFEDAIRKAEVDFKREVLILLRHTEGSGSVHVTLQLPNLRGEKLTVKIARKVPDVTTTDMAYYCFGLAVSKSHVTIIEFQVASRRSILVPVIDE